MVYFIGCFNNIFLNLVWSLAAVVYPVVAFWVYVALGNELTIAKAFTVCISHFFAFWLLVHKHQIGDRAL
jgi:hypothetical protein